MEKDVQLLSHQCLPQRAATRLSPGWEKPRREQKPPNPAEGWADSFAWQRCRCGEQQGLWQRQQAQLPALTSCRTAGRTGPFSQAGAPRLSTPHPALCHTAPFFKIPAPGPLLQLGRLSVLPVCPGRAKPGQALPGQQHSEQQHRCPPAQQPHEHSQPRASCPFPVGHRCAQQECRSFCAGLAGERSKMLQSLPWSPAQDVPVPLPGCSQNCPATACFTQQE